ncbi:hypothetical protein [Microvirga antarctica]|uniref:hypothetical protein n=1 Tax=Microvirga antarctica TaxID=2819233 RepID=UPI001B3098AD|nr:hypothetical protein [Microvirga antarctica]
MTRLIWIFASLGVAIWTLVAWGVYGLIGLFGDLLARNADVVTSHPGTVEWLSWGLSAIRNVGLAAVVFVWGLVSLLILAVPTLLSVAAGTLGRRGGPLAQGPMRWPPQQGWPSGEPRPGYRDVTPAKPESMGDEIQRIERR